MKKKKKRCDWLAEFEKLCKEGGNMSDKEVERAIKQVEKKRTRDILNQT